jgi:uncharacterized protein YdeI (YjbR/CyaY-like superfamily)
VTTPKKTAPKKAVSKKAAPEMAKPKEAIPKRAAAKPRASSAERAPERAADEIRAFCDAAAFDAWLEQHHASHPGFWLEIAKKSSATTSVDYGGALTVALAWGWIDGQKRSKDAGSWLQRFTPRRGRSVWSAINRDKALALIAEGRMRPAGLAEVERAKADGRWDAAYASQSRAVVPDDLAAALAGSPRAASHFAALDSRNRYAIHYRVTTAKRPETRKKRIDDFVAMLARGERLYP